MPNIILNDQKVRKIILNGRTYFGKDLQRENIIFNHGDVVGLNPYYAQRSGVYDNQTISDSTISGTSYWDKKVMTFSTPIDKRKYSKIYIDIEVPAVYASNKDIMLGVRSCTKGLPPSEYASDMFDKIIYVVGSYSQMNYTHTSPWYECPRVTIPIDISDLTDNFCYLCLYDQAGAYTIHSIWME